MENTGTWLVWMISAMKYYQLTRQKILFLVMIKITQSQIRVFGATNFTVISIPLLVMRSSLLVIPFYHFSVSIAGNYFIWVVWITMMADYFTFRSYFWNLWSLTSCQQQSKIGPVWNCWAFGTVCPFSLTSQHLTYTNQTKLTLRKEGGTWHQQ